MRILTKVQEQILNLLGKSELSHQFYFTGGSALSEFYLHHRYSYDLNFFTKEKNALNMDVILSFLHSLPALKNIRYEKIYDRRIFFLRFTDESLKVEFSLYPFERVAETKNVNGLQIDSLDDLFVNKLAALADRYEEKDLVDLYFILSAKGADHILWGLAKVKEKFGIEGVQYIIQRKLVSLPNDLENMPYLIKPMSGYKKFFEKVLIKLAKKYWAGGPDDI